MTSIQPQMAQALPIYAPTAPMMSGPMMANPMMPNPMMAGPGYANAYGQQAPVYYTSMSQLPPGVVPASQQMLAAALGQGQVGSQMIGQEPAPSVLKSVIKMAAIGGGVGAVVGLIPFLPPGMLMGGLIGAAVGGLLGFVKGTKAKKEHEVQIQSQQAQIQAQATAVANGVGAPSIANGMPTAVGSAPMAPGTPPKKKPVVMSPEMRKKWAAKVQADRIAHTPPK